jgi:hypothetical protein
MRSTKTTVVTKVQKLIGGLETYADTKTLFINGALVKATAVIQQLQAKLDLLQAAEAAREAFQRAVAAAKPVTSEVDATIAEVRIAAIAMFGHGSEACMAMGFPPPRKRQPSVATKAQAVAQNAATRRARNTMGRKQKLAIRAMVPVQAISLVPTTPPVISEPASPSPAATGSSSTPSSPSPSSPPSGNGTPQR